MQNKPATALRLALLSVGVFFSLGAMAQLAQDFSDFDPTYKNSVSLDGGFGFGSNAVSSELATTYYKSGYITTAMKDVVSNRFKFSELNRLGADANMAARLSHFATTKKGAHIGYWFSVEDKLNLNASFTGDMFDLYFRGNKLFEGRTANLRGSHLDYIHYRKASLGWAQEIKHQDQRWIYGVGVSVLQGVQNFSLSTGDKSRLFTEQAGVAVEPELSIVLLRSDSTTGQLSDFAGQGLGGDLFWVYDEPGKKRIALEVHDVGRIAWNSRSTETRIDTSVYFSGVEIQNILKPDTSDFAAYDSTYLKRFLKTTSTGYTTWLPATITLSYQHYLCGTKLLYRGGIQYRIKASYSALVYAGIQYIPCKAFAIGAQAAFGGYTGWSYGLDATLRPGAGTSLRLRANQLNGFLSKQTGSEAVSVCIQKTF